MSDAELENLRARLRTAIRQAEVSRLQAILEDLGGHPWGVKECSSRSSTTPPGSVTDEELQQVVRAINRQITEDFAPYWGMSATLRLEGRSAQQPDTLAMPYLRGEAIIYLWDQADIAGALGYHFQNARGIPFGFVFTEIARAIGEPWSVTLSHEALELLGDPETNLLVMGPHPSEDRDVFHWFEMCDAVQAETYDIDGVAVSNFVLPLYFTGTREVDRLEPGTTSSAGATVARLSRASASTPAATSASSTPSREAMRPSASAATRSR